MQMNEALKQRIARIVSPNVVELSLRRNAQFGKINLASGFDLISHIRASEERGDIRRHFAAIVSGGKS